MALRLSRSILGEAEAQAVSRVILEDGYLGMGNETRLFEEELAAYLNVEPSQIITVNTALRPCIWLWTPWPRNAAPRAARPRCSCPL